MVTSDTYEALFGCNHLGGISECRVALCIPFPFLLCAMLCLPCLFVPPVGFICIFAHFFTCPYMSLAASVSSMLQHNEVMDIQSKPTFVPHGYHLLFPFLFTFSLVCLLSCFFAYHVYHTYLLYASFICSLHIFLPLLVCWFLSLSLYVHTWSKDA